MTVFDSQIWRSKVIQYRKWEQRHDLAIAPNIRFTTGQALTHGDFFVVREWTHWGPA